MSQKLNGGGRERMSRVADLRLKSYNLGPKNSLFLPTTALELVQNSQRKGNGGNTPHAGGLPHVKEPLEPSNSTICPRNAPNGPQKPQNLCTLAVVSFNPRIGHIFGT